MTTFSSYVKSPVIKVPVKWRVSFTRIVLKKPSTNLSFTFKIIRKIKTENNSRIEFCRALDLLHNPKFNIYVTCFFSIFSHFNISQVVFEIFLTITIAKVLCIQSFLSLRWNFHLAFKSMYFQLIIQYYHLNSSVLFISYTRIK